MGAWERGGVQQLGTFVVLMSLGVVLERVWNDRHESAGFLGLGMDHGMDSFERQEWGRFMLDGWA